MGEGGGEGGGERGGEGESPKWRLTGAEGDGAEENGRGLRGTFRQLKSGTEEERGRGIERDSARERESDRGGV